MLNKIIDWFKACYPDATPEVASIQYGCMVEEIHETLLVTEDIEFCHEYEGHVLDVDYAERNYKRKNPSYVRFLEELNPDKRTEHLAGLIDVIWTAVTSGTAMGYDMQGALGEVVKSNFSKFVDGKPVFDENGKVTKGEGYFKPDLYRFANPEITELPNKKGY